ncbi:hypothetical protein NOM01_05665 [Sporolactobacillus sp. STSJ-5]|uniref:DUF6932 family protein n=1 Tax=Sporolactobacillus sp. STSJ-5 TaxID=2965076 RepID=UPI0021078940|nr:hypothetical protein [Sporolactobacillus sp. STSJ-5]MCQ2009485.1 hypothetical protein [Sporolactobacillus sp. STSJ-5]
MSLVFNENGVLSPGDYLMTIEQLKSSLLVQGPGGGEPWNQQKPLMLVNNLSILVDQLHRVGIDEIFIDSSFVRG